MNALEKVLRANLKDGKVVLDASLNKRVLKACGSQAAQQEQWKALLDAGWSRGDGCLLAPPKRVAVKETAARTNKQGRGIPSPKVPTEDTAHYGDHLNAIHNSRKLREYPPAQHVAYMLNREMWLKQRGGFGKPLEFPLTYVMQQTGLGKAAAANAVRHVVECGFFRRLDNGNGGKRSDNGATYVPTLPDYGS